MRRSLVLAASVVLLGCGSMQSHADSAADAVALGSIAGDLPDGLTLTMDVAAMRRDPSLAAALTKAKASSPSDVAELVDDLDHLDARAAEVDGHPTAIVVMWGRFPKDPTEVAFFRAGAKALTLAATLPSGVREYETGDPTDGHLFAVSRSVWVVASSSAISRVRSRFANSADAPAEPHGDLLKIRVDRSFLKDETELRGVDHFEVSLAPRLASLDGVLEFDREDDAKQAQVKVQLLAAVFVAAAAEKAKSCRALDKLDFEVKRDGKKLEVEVRGIGDAAAAWDPAECPRVDGPELERSRAKTGD